MMFDNEFIYETKYSFDLPFFIQLGKKHITKQWRNSVLPETLRYADQNPLAVKGIPYLENIRKIFPKLNPVIKLFVISPGTCPAHIDEKRSCTLNIPIKNCNEKTQTYFLKEYKVVEKTVIQYGLGSFLPQESNEFLSYVEDGYKTFSFGFNKPTLLNTKEPHGMINDTSENRLLWTWSYDDTFENAVRDFKNVEQFSN
jgi:hypothetical protein